MRKFRRLAVACAALLAFSAMAFGQAPRPPIKIGVVLPYTGVFSVVGQEVNNGLELGLAKAGRGGGREFQMIKEDSEAKPDVGLTKTRKLVERDNVDVLMGPVSGAVALAMRDYVHRQGVPLIVPLAGTRVLTAPASASPWIFRVLETTDQANFPMGQWVLRKTPHRKIAIVGSDFVVARHAVEAFIAAFKAGGGEIVKEIYAPLNTPDYAPYLAQMGELGADAVYAWFGGADSIRFVRAYKQYGWQEKIPLLGYNSLVDDILLPAMGDAALGIVSVGHYAASVDTPESRSFVKEYEARYKVRPTRYSETGYVAAQLIAAAADALKGDLSDRAKFRDAIRSAAAKIRPPRGPIEFDRYQQVITDVYVLKVERRDGRLVNTIVDRIPQTSQEGTWKWWNK